MSKIIICLVSSCREQYIVISNLGEIDFRWSKIHIRSVYIISMIVSQTGKKEDTYFKSLLLSYPIFSLSITINYDALPLLLFAFYAVRLPRLKQVNTFNTIKKNQNCCVRAHSKDFFPIFQKYFFLKIFFFSFPPNSGNILIPRRDIVQSLCSVPQRLLVLHKDKDRARLMSRIAQTTKK